MKRLRLTITAFIALCVCCALLAADPETVGNGQMPPTPLQQAAAAQQSPEAAQALAAEAAQAGAAQGLTQQKPKSKEKKPVGKSYAWEVNSFGQRKPAPIDTALYNYFQNFIPSQVSYAYAATGNLGAEGLNMLYSQRRGVSQFFFNDPLRHWLPSLSTCKFYNTRIPMTLLSYNFGGGQDTEQNWLKGVFSGNVNKRLQFGADIDYLYSKGSYNYQATNDVIWGLNGSYIGERWQIELMYHHWNLLNKENGGITDPLYITDPAKVQGGDAKVDTKAIPTNLTAAHSRLVGGRVFMANAYNLLGFWRETQVNDTTTVKNYVPAGTIVWTFNYYFDKHIFSNTNKSEADKFWENRYLSTGDTYDETKFWCIENVVGMRLEEGINKWLPFGLMPYVRYNWRKFKQTADTVPHIGEDRPEGLTPWPEGVDIAQIFSQHRLWVGATLVSTRYKHLNINAKAEFGVIGTTAGNVSIEGNISSRFKVAKDTMSVSAFASFENAPTTYLLKKYISNHFIWQNNFGNKRDLRVGGRIDFPMTWTSVDVFFSNVQNYTYFGPDCMPVQYNPSVQIFSATLRQDLHLGILHWRNAVTFQTSSNQEVIPLPKLALYSNLYLMFKIAKVLDVQLGVDCSYYTRYYAPSYQPATMTFYNQRDTQIGNYPFMNVYANFKLKKARFYVMMSHVNQGWFSKEYFSMPLYPVNPRRFQLGVSVDFAN